jgi:hypothetical protein
MLDWRTRSIREGRARAFERSKMHTLKVMGIIRVFPKLAKWVSFFYRHPGKSNIRRKRE